MSALRRYAKIRCPGKHQASYNVSVKRDRFLFHLGKISCIGGWGWGSKRTFKANVILRARFCSIMGAFGGHVGAILGHPKAIIGSNSTLKFTEKYIQGYLKNTSDNSLQDYFMITPQILPKFIAEPRNK